MSHTRLFYRRIKIHHKHLASVYKKMKTHSQAYEFRSKQAFDPKFYPQEPARYLSWNISFRPPPIRPIAWRRMRHRVLHIALWLTPPIWASSAWPAGQTRRRRWPNESTRLPIFHFAVTTESYFHSVYVAAKMRMLRGWQALSGKPHPK